jgi:hypothetical protein
MGQVTHAQAGWRQLHAAAIRFDLAHQDAQQGTFAAAVGANKRGSLATVQVETDTVQYQNFAVSFCDISDLQHCLSPIITRCQPGLCWTARNEKRHRQSPAALNDAPYEMAPGTVTAGEASRHRPAKPVHIWHG